MEQRHGQEWLSLRYPYFENAADLHGLQQYYMLDSKINPKAARGTLIHAVV